jgi:hypothetical protein
MFTYVARSYIPGDCVDANRPVASVVDPTDAAMPLEHGIILSSNWATRTSRWPALSAATGPISRTDPESIRPREVEDT